MINVTKPYLPDRKKLEGYIDLIYNTTRMANNGPLVRDLTDRLEEYLNVENLLLVANGTLALQIAYRTFGIKGRAITTPFSFVATASSLMWEGITPIFSDIDSQSFCIDPQKIRTNITSETTCIVPVHVFGNPCDMQKIEQLVHNSNLKVIYDGAHAFGVKYRRKSIYSFGDAVTLSFHATKLFHTVEGGAIVFKNREDCEKAKLMVNFGISKPDTIEKLGINAKMNEFQAAMGLCVLDEIETIMEKRQFLWNRYDERLKNYFQLQKRNPEATNNYSYFPILFEDEKSLLCAKRELNNNDINPRRYFYPSLDTLAFLSSPNNMAISRDISKRILCIPIYPDLSTDDQDKVIKILLEQHK
jgi:dTDP-4-amino-4,6-dideoxygalactose transaminase